MRGKKKALAILSVSAGAGHLRAADAVLKTAEESFSGEVEAIHLDVMDFVPKIFKSLYAESYMEIVKRSPLLWGAFYGATDEVEDEKSQLRAMRLAVETLNSGKLFSALEKFAPDHILCTHFLPAEILTRHSRPRKGFEARCWMQVTDYDVHAFWVVPRMRGYFVATDEVAWRLSSKSKSPLSIHVTGIPIMPDFQRPPARAEAAAELGIDPSKFTVLMMSGGFGLVGLDTLSQLLLEKAPDAQIVAIAGRNEKLLAKLEKVAANFKGRLKPMGFTKTIERVMAASDVAVTKPGGLSTSECFAMGLPMVIVSPIPGQEERNSDYALENGAALKGHDPAMLEYKIGLLSKSPERLRAMRAAAKSIAKPDAAKELLKVILADSSV